MPQKTNPNEPNLFAPIRVHLRFLLEQLGVVLDNNGVTMDKLGGINGHKNIVFATKTLFLRIFYGIIMALEYSTKTEYN